MSTPDLYGRTPITDDDETIARQFAEFRDYINIFALCAGSLIFISCLGLLGMATYNAETRMKEVSVRKVLGATPQNLLMLLSKDFLKLITLAAIIAVPASWFIGDLILQNFTYRIKLGFGLFVVGVGFTLVVAFFTVASQSMRAAIVNPIDTLRDQ